MQKGNANLNAKFNAELNAKCNENLNAKSCERLQIETSQTSSRWTSQPTMDHALAVYCKNRSSRYVRMFLRYSSNGWYACTWNREKQVMTPLTVSQRNSLHSSYANPFVLNMATLGMLTMIDCFGYGRAAPPIWFSAYNWMPARKWNGRPKLFCKLSGRQHPSIYTE